MSTTKTWPGGGTAVTPAAYSIPAAGELNWATLSDFLNALGDGAQSTTFQKFAVRKATTSPVTVSATTDCIVVTDLSVAGAVTVNLPAGQNKQVFFIVDGKGDAATNNITINRNGSDTIAGSTSLVLSTNRGACCLVFNSGDTDWKIVGIFSGITSFVNPMDSAGDMIYGGAAGVPTKLDSGTAQTWLLSGGAGAPTWSNTTTTGKTIDGSADEVQLNIQGHSTQTNNILNVETSAGADIFSVTTTTIPITKPIRPAASTGSASLPTYATDNDSDTGMYGNGSGDIRFSNNGTNTTTIDGNGKFSTTATVKVASADANQSEIDYYEATTFSATFTQAGGYSATVTVKAQRLGKKVTLEVPTFQGSATAATTIVSGATDIPARLRPAIESRNLSIIINGGGVSNNPGGIYFTTGGQIQVSSTPSGSGFTNGTTAGLGAGGTSACSWSYFTS